MNIIVPLFMGNALVLAVFSINSDNVSTLERIVLRLVTFGAGFLVGKTIETKE